MADFRTRGRFAALIVGLVLLMASAAVGPADAKPVKPGDGDTTPTTITLLSGRGVVGSLDTNTDVSVDGGRTFEPARIVSENPLYSTLPGTNWVSDTTGTPRNFVTTIFRTRFELPAGFQNASISIRVHADNAARVLLNGKEIGRQVDAETRSNFQNPAEIYNATGPFVAGTNVLQFVVHNFSGPMGLDYSATVTYEDGVSWSDCLYTDPAPHNSVVVAVFANSKDDQTHDLACNRVRHIHKRHGFNEDTEACIAKVLGSPEVDRRKSPDDETSYLWTLKNPYRVGQAHRLFIAAVRTDRASGKILSAHTNDASLNPNFYVDGLYDVGPPDGDWAGCLEGRRSLQWWELPA